MDEEKLIQVSFQIPPGALDSLTNLARQLRLLAQAAGTPVSPAVRTAESESVESGSFDPERFYELQRNMPGPQAVRRTVPDVADAPAVSSALSQVQDADAVSAGIREDPADAKGAGDGFSQQSAQLVRAFPPENGAQFALPEERGSPPPPAEGARTETRDLLPAAVRGEVTGGIEAPAGAGAVVQAQPEIPQSRWNGVTEELTVPGEAPLTAQAVSMAFERDGRRYDNGFPLY